VFVGEGPFDAWAFHRRLDPRDVGVAVLGTILHKRHIRLIEALEPEEVVFCFDPDAIDKAQKSAEMAYSVGLAASFMSPEADPDELSDDRLAEAVSQRKVVDDLGVSTVRSRTTRR
jgi:DNA primase